MPRETADDVLSPSELSELLADATGTTADDIDRQAATVEIGPPEDAVVVADE
jgi:hypothetical protein